MLDHGATSHCCCRRHHLISRFHEEARQLAPAGQRMDALTKSKALRRSLKHLGRACFLTSLTTAVGFASLYFAEMPILRQFGLYAAAGVFVRLSLGALSGSSCSPLDPRQC